MVIGEVLRKATGETTETFSNKKLFGPLGITHHQWSFMPSGKANTGGHLFLTIPEPRVALRLRLAGARGRLLRPILFFAPVYLPRYAIPVWVVLGVGTARLLLARRKKPADL